MNLRRKAITAAAAGASLALLATACQGKTEQPPSTSGSEFNAALTKVVNPSDTPGGTLNLWTSQDADSWDPVRGYYAFVWDLNRLYTRTLVSYDAKTGVDGVNLVPDLAAAMPEISSDGTTYTFTLRDGLKWDDGKPITSKDVKYGIERVWAQDVLSGGPVYLPNLLDPDGVYKGPYQDTDPNHLGLASVETPDDKTIVFHLPSAYSDFMYLLAMPGSGPVPQARDTGAQYGLAPASSGPYKFESIDPGKKVVWVRNDNWDKSTDPFRKALPDRIELTITTNADDLDSRLIAGTADLDVGQTGVQAAARTQILNDPNLKKYADTPVTGFIRYAAISSKVPPLDNVNCRKAIFYAADHTALQTARGGPFAGGDIGVNMLPPNIPGSDTSYDPYNMAQGAPQPDKAKEALAACGHPTGFDTVIAVRNNRPAEVKTAEALQASLKEVGINASIDQYDGAQIATIVGSPDNAHAKGYGIMIAGWGADWQTGTGYLQPLIDANFILDNGNFNLPEINDPKIQDLFAQVAKETDPTKAAEIYNQMNHLVMEGAYYLPFVYDKALNYRNPRLTNVYIHNAFGMVDFQALGVNGS